MEQHAATDSVIEQGGIGQQGRLDGRVIERPQRWDEPFDPDMSEQEVDRILSLPPFNKMDPSKFPRSVPLRGIIRNDTRIRHFQKGDIIVRKGQYGNSAYLITAGQIRVVLNQDGPELGQMYGEETAVRKGLWSAFAQLWRNPRGSEVRDPSTYLHLAVRENRHNDVRMYFQDVPYVMENYETKALVPGDFMGEISALGRTPYTATVFAETETRLLEIQWDGLMNLRRYVDDLREHIDRIYRERSLQVHLQETPIFKHLSPVEIADIADQTAFRSYGSFDWYSSYKKLVEKSAQQRLAEEPIVAEEGDYPNGLILIRSGFARLSQRFGYGHRTISFLGSGRDYGMGEIVHNWRYKQQVPLQRSLRAVGHLDILQIPTALIEKYLLGPDRENPIVPADLLPPPMAQSDTAPAAANDKAKAKATAKRRRARVDDNVLEFMVENRFINGTATMIIDLDRCTRCDDCVRACAATHDNNPRFIRHGTRLDNYMVANACMHCADPVCMIGCPTGAISRDRLGGQVVINDSTCIGCSTCANSCPYDNIRMVMIRDKRGEYILDRLTHAPIVKATKCDLCMDQLGGPACQRACPHDALIRADIQSKDDSLALWMKR